MSQLWADHQWLPNGETQVRGHPTVEAENDHGHIFRVTVCSECESVRTILLLSHDRWYCTNCRNSGDARPTVIPVTRPGRGAS